LVFEHVIDLGSCIRLLQLLLLVERVEGGGGELLIEFVVLLEVVNVHKLVLRHQVAQTKVVLHLLLLVVSLLETVLAIAVLEAGPAALKVVEVKVLGLLYVVGVFGTQVVVVYHVGNFGEDALEGTVLHERNERVAAIAVFDLPPKAFLHDVVDTHSFIQVPVLIAGGLVLQFERVVGWN